MELKKHIDTISIIATIITVSYLTVGSIQYSLNQICNRIENLENKIGDLDNEFHHLEKEVAIMKTVLIMKNIIPEHLAVEKQNE